MTTGDRNRIPTFPARLRELREAAGLTQEQLARAAETTFSSVSKLERGERSPTLELAARLAGALGCGVEKLLQPVGAAVPRRGKGRPRNTLGKLAD